MNEYYEWGDEFSHVYLEDSYVLRISEDENELVFDIDFVLREMHPLFKLHGAEEKYCYHKGLLIFSNISSLKWVSKNMVSFKDLSGDEDYGNIDVLKRNNKGEYFIEGDWGSLVLNSAYVSLKFI